MTDLRVALPFLEPVMGDEPMVFLRAVERAYPVLDLAGFASLFVERHAIARAWGSFLTEFDVLLSPVWTTPPFAHGFDVASDANARAVLEAIRCVVPANLLGLPAAAVPAAVTDGLPACVQLLAGRFREDLCLEAAAAVEAALGVVTPIDPVF
jgi:amidase